MATVKVDGSIIRIETDLLSAEVHTEGYVSGVAAGTLVDKTTGARDLGSGLDIVDFLLEPLPDEPGMTENAYHRGDLFHGNLIKRYVELPQICTGAQKLDFEVQDFGDTVGVRQWFTYRAATYGREPGSVWEQTLVFRDGLRYFLAADEITSANDVEHLILRIDMPGHLKHNAGDSFEQIHLSYHGNIPSSEFVADFPPDARYLYRREQGVPDRMVRAYQVRLDGKPGPWLAGMTLEPDVVYEAWCHQRGYVCFIQEIGGFHVFKGEHLSAAYVVGWFDDVEAMNAAYDEYKGASRIARDEEGFEIE
ncbi:MAG: hypothetical protein FJX75_09975 [Armatimonadetes bacterium]|nr:hypothetical protein [Armatimonadota bacterium]